MLLTCFLAESDFQREVLQRRQQDPLGDWAAWMVTPEDLILLKLLAYRPEDQVDIADILFIQRALDEHYLQNGAANSG